ncbi:hypothetical protein [uncultured Muribaculum sp.]|uniref:hypothetical protein n=1 Tax=uncultured Muribaculum sp. TaxID=1918613 RepID=UPI0025E3AE96|nr:hypothetical protein [uncultured Muribaculum sp.]
MKKLFMTLTLVTGLAFGSIVTVAQSNDIEQISAIAHTPSARPVSGGIELTTPGDAPCCFYIYSITGQMVKSAEISGSAVVELPRGCYIIKCAKWSKKVVVK